MSLVRNIGKKGGRDKSKELAFILIGQYCVDDEIKVEKLIYTN